MSKITIVDGQKTTVLKLEQTANRLYLLASTTPRQTPTNYIPVRVASVTIEDSQLVEGFNIIGVNYAGPVTVNIPGNPLPTKLIFVKDESGNAQTNPITVNPL